MEESRRVLLIFICQLFLCASAEYAFSQEEALNKYEYLSPSPFSFYHNPETVTIIRFGEKIDLFSLSDDLLEVTGAISGRHSGKFTISKDNLTLIFIPNQIFAFNEKVILHLNHGIKTLSGQYLPPLDYWFRIRQKTSSELINRLSGEKEEINKFHKKSVFSAAGKGTPLSYLDFVNPGVTLSNNPAQGNILTAVTINSTNYLYIFDNKSVIKYIKVLPHPVSNMKPHPSGIITYFDSFINGFIAFDTLLNYVDTFTMKNGYKTDAHEILLLKNGNVFLLSYDPQIVDMSKVISGGDPNATVTGLVIQELDSNKNLLLQWRSWDYFNITDSFSDLLASVVDYVHGNSLDADTDTTLIISSRNMNEVTKINILNGQILWRLGGKNNEFTFENDLRRFAGQHSVIKQKNGTLTMFDNGVGLNPLYSRGIEYELDEITRNVKLLHEYRPDFDVYANVSGNLQRLDNGNTFIFWGPLIDVQKQFISEFDQSGKEIFEAWFDINTHPSYRAYRSTWEPRLFTFSTDTLHIEGEVQNTTLYRTFVIRNNSSSKIIITSAYHNNPGFVVKDLPLEVEADSETSLTIAFPSFIPGKLTDNIIFCQETDSTIVTRSLFVSIDNKPTTGIERQVQTFCKVSPNPFNEEFNVEVTGPGRFLLKLIDLTGRQIWNSESVGIELFKVDMSREPDGLYILYLEEVNTGKLHTMKLIKQK